MIQDNSREQLLAECLGLTVSSRRCGTDAWLPEDPTVGFELKTTTNESVTTHQQFTIARSRQLRQKPWIIAVFRQCANAYTITESYLLSPLVMEDWFDGRESQLTIRLKPWSDLIDLADERLVTTLLGHSAIDYDPSAVYTAFRRYFSGSRSATPCLRLLRSQSGRLSRIAVLRAACFCLRAGLAGEALNNPKIPMRLVRERGVSVRTSDELRCNLKKLLANHLCPETLH